MPKFRKKPVEVEAIQYRVDHASEIIRWAHSGLPPEANTIVALAPDNCLMLRALEGYLLATPDDWIVKGVEGEFYPVKPSIFAATYEPVE